jgi:hypothetical protein
VTRREEECVLIAVTLVALSATVALTLLTQGSDGLLALAGMVTSFVAWAGVVVGVSVLPFSLAARAFGVSATVVKQLRVVAGVALIVGSVSLSLAFLIARGV